MELNQFHFASPLWLLAGLLIPIVACAFFLFYKIKNPGIQLEKFIDAHLLPHLLVSKGDKKHSLRKNLFLWGSVWVSLTLALAGPRFTFREIETFSKNESLVIILDLSESMNASDVAPSRLIRAKQKIEDLLNDSEGVKIGLIAFAADPHMIAPLTEDKETIRYLLPSLETHLVHIQGSRLTSALDMASHLLKAEPGNHQAILILSDGGFEDASAIKVAKTLSLSGIVIHAMGVGTEEGSVLKDEKGNIIKTGGSPLLSKLDKTRLNEVSIAGKGEYLSLNEGFEGVLSALKNNEDFEKKSRKYQIWDEHFYLLIVPALPMILWWFRRGYIFALFFLFSTQLQAYDYFKNSEEQGKEAFEAGDFEKASSLFQDPYRQGVAYYRSGNFSEAEKCFVKTGADYNLGNSFAKQQKLKEAIQAYERVIAAHPDHTLAQENLELVKKMLEEQPPQDNPEEDSDPSEEQEQKQEEKKEETCDEGKTEGSRTEEDIDADLWLEALDHDPTQFLKNQFYIESKNNGTKEGINPW